MLVDFVDSVQERLVDSWSAPSSKATGLTEVGIARQSGLCPPPYCEKLLTSKDANWGQ
jgi:hypothetical protein